MTHSVEPAIPALIQSELNADLVLSVFIIDDDKSTQLVLKAFFVKEGYKVTLFSDPLEVLQVLEKSDSKSVQACDLVICDLKMPSMDGLEVIEKLNELQNRPPIVLLTGYASIETAAEGMKKGAYDYITKPINFVEIGIVARRAITADRRERDYRALKKELSRSWMLEDLVGKSPQMHAVFDFIKRISKVSCNVLVTGESGAGKEVVVRAIHARSPRADKPFVAINCTTIPEALLESELFGHAKGSFTGATEKRQGLLAEANEGTLFLDEIGDMALPLQAKLLRFLQDKLVKPVGENTYRQLDVRIIAATNHDLKIAVREKRFREDLYYRLCVAPLEIPPLRNRREDILLLADHFLTKFTRRADSQIGGFTKAASAKLHRLNWPGNVRELENTIERAVVFCDQKMIDEKDIHVVDMSETLTPEAFSFASMVSLDTIERQYIEYVIERTGNKLEKAAEVLGINRKTLYRKQLEYTANSTPSERPLDS
jgi:DNA-binding NtrC family response regulator